MRTGIFGGTFNPVHNGHIRLAESYIEALGLDRLLVIPNCLPPHKASDNLIDGNSRMQMCQLAFAGNPRCEVSGIELARHSKSYTVDTLETLRARYPKDEFYLIMGSDMFLTLTEWHRYTRIFQLAVMCVGEREPNLCRKLEAYGEYLREHFGARYIVIDLEPVLVSSTMVREWISEGRDITSLVPPKVADYIWHHGLYRPSEN